MRGFLQFACGLALLTSPVVAMPALAKQSSGDQTPITTAMIAEERALNIRMGKPDTWHVLNAKREIYAAALSRYDRPDAGISRLDLAYLFWRYGDILRRTGAFANGEAQIRRALGLLREALPPTDPRLLRCMTYLARVLRAQDKQEALDLLHEAAVKYLTIPGLPEADAWATFEILGERLLWAGRPADALPWLEAASMSTDAKNRSSMEMRSHWAALGKAQYAMKRYADAHASFMKGLNVPRGADNSDIVFGLARSEAQIGRTVDGEARIGAYISAMGHSPRCPPISQLDDRQRAELTSPLYAEALTVLSDVMRIGGRPGSARLCLQIAINGSMRRTFHTGFSEAQRIRIALHKSWFAAVVATNWELARR